MTVILYTPSGAPPSVRALQEAFAASLPGHIRSRIEGYPLGGRMRLEELRPVHRLFMWIGQKVEIDPEAKAKMLDVDNVDRTGIAPILPAFGPSRPPDRAPNGTQGRPSSAH